MKKLPIFEKRLFLKYSKEIDTDNNHEHNCLMIELDTFEYIQRLQEQILQEDIYDDGTGTKGIEDCTHITILYGINNDIQSTDFASGLPSIKSYGKINVTGLTIFECEKYDVLKFDVENPMLNKAFNYMESNVDNCNKYPEYHGHITACYLKKGEGKKYVDEKLKFFVTPAGYRYSSKGYIEKFVI